MRLDQNVINNNDNFDQTNGPLRVLLVSVANETESQLGWITIDVLGGEAPYSYQWYNLKNELLSTHQNLIAVTSGTYTVHVTDFEGMEVSLTVQVSANISYNYLIDERGDIIIDEVGDGILV
jgi:hypothetical protein